MIKHFEIDKIIKIVELKMKNNSKTWLGMLCMNLSALLFSSAATAEAVHSKLSIDKHNIKVWTIQDPNNPVLSYQAETILDSSLERAVALVLDVENANSWVPNVASAQVLSQDLNSGRFKIYMVLDFPFPLKDRDLVIQGSMSKDAKGIISIKNKAVQQGKSKNADYIRIKNYQGDWTFQKLAENKVKVTTKGYADPEGAIPQSVTNMFVQQQPYQMLQKMKLELAKPNKHLVELPNILK